MICDYCEETKYTQEHNGELICYDCRIDLVDTEFEEYFQKEVKYNEEISKVISHKLRLSKLN